MPKPIRSIENRELREHLKSLRRFLINDRRTVSARYVAEAIRRIPNTNETRKHQ